MSRHRSTKEKIANALFVTGCVLLAVSIPMPIVWPYSLLWLAFCGSLIGASHILVPFERQLRPLHETPIVDPDHVTSRDSKDRGKSAI